jgi:clan AA aspartic protease (TIGR02281 family)
MGFYQDYTNKAMREAKTLFDRISKTNNIGERFMFNLLLALITGLVIGWNFHSFFMQLNPANILKNEINIVQLVKEEIAPNLTPPKQSIQEIQKNIQIRKKNIPETLNKEQNISTPPIKKTDNFYDFLQNDLFSDAMSLYVDASESKLLIYQTTLLEYFTIKVENNPQEAVEQMLEVQELEPTHTKINVEVLHEIEDNDYAEKAKILLNLIKKRINTKEEYRHQLPLKKIGEHFIIEVSINNEPLSLLLDTGATLTMINEEKLSSELTLIKENIVLNTAGGEINAKLQEATTFSIGEIKLENFQIVSSTFEQKDADGLLGMNFFKKFKFKIDQEKAILFLSEK